MQRLVKTVVTDPGLGGHEELAAVDAALHDALADLGFVAPDRGGIDEPIARCDRIPDRAHGFVARALQDTEPGSRPIDIVVEREERA